VGAGAFCERSGSKCGREKAFVVFQKTLKGSWSFGSFWIKPKWTYQKRIFNSTLISLGLSFKTQIIMLFTLPCVKTKMNIEIELTVFETKL